MSGRSDDPDRLVLELAVEWRSGNNAVEVCAHHLHSAVPLQALRAAVPRDLERVILTCLTKEPEARPVSVAAVAESLQRCRDAGTWGAERAAVWWESHGRV